MKTKLILLSVMLTSYAIAQKAYVTGTLPVKVEEKTLFYFGEGLEVTSADAIVTNEGNVQVRGGDFKVTNNTTNDNFFLPWTDEGSYTANGVQGGVGYGQLIVEQTRATEGKIAMERKMPAPAAFTDVQSAFPFKFFNGAELEASTGITFTEASRYNHPAFVWNNAMIRWDKVYKGNAGITSGGWSPFSYYIIRNASSYSSYDNGAKRQHKGIPNNVGASRALPDHSSMPDLRFSARNIYNERYTSYVDDPYILNKATNLWGKNVYQFANPYTSNIDLSYIGFDETATLNGVALNDGNALANIEGVYKYTGVTWSGINANENTYAQNHATAVNGKFVAGDNTVLLVKPFEPFIIKTTAPGGNFVFGDGLKTFAYNARVATNVDGTGTVAYRNSNTANTNTADEFYQVALNLHTSSGDANGNITYVVANENLQNGVGGILEAENLFLGNKTGFFTKQEVAEGEGLDPAFSTNRMLINQINTSYVGVPIPLFFRVNPADVNETFTIKFDLMNSLVNVTDEELNFNNPDARFYFRDNLLNEYILINADSEYTFTQTENTDERFELFYGAINSTLGVDDILANTNETVIYNNDNQHSIKFVKDWNKANVSVFTAVGQVVYSKNDIDTSNDFVLPLNNENVSVFIVRIENTETGEVVSKKIIK